MTTNVPGDLVFNKVFNKISGLDYFIEKPIIKNKSQKNNRLLF